MVMRYMEGKYENKQNYCSKNGLNGCSRINRYYVSPFPSPKELNVIIV